MDRSTLYNVADLKTGDIILFSGTCFVSRVIKFFTGSRWSHIGMIVKDPDYPYPLIYESSHYTGIMGLDIGRKTSGVQILPFNERRRTFAGDMALRRLEYDLSDNELYRLRIFRIYMVGKPFEEDRLQMLAASRMFKFLPSREDLSSVFCSELIAQCYQEMGLLGQDLPSNKFSPPDFSDERDLKLTRGKLGPQIIIKEYRP